MLEAQFTKRLRDFPLEFSFRVQPGEIIVLMGNNGSGKSTVLNILAGLTHPDSGRIFLNEKPLFDQTRRVDIPSEERRIGYVFQNPAVFPHLSVRENIAFGLRARHLPGEEIRKRTDLWLNLLGIEDLSPVKATNISGGQKQRVALARALAIDPSLLMLDEPFTALDAESEKGVKAILKKIVTDTHIPCIVVTHRNVDIRQIADHVYAICRGRKVWEGSPSDIPEDFDSWFRKKSEARTNK